MIEIELLPAYMWNCEACGRENFERGIVPEMTEEDKIEMCEERGIDVEDPGHWMLMPTDVVCSHCKAEFKTKHYEYE